MKLQYLLLFTHRSGSSWLCDLMNSAGLGPIKEFHEEDNFNDFTEYRGLKVAWDALHVLSGQTDLSKLKLIYLRREDRLRQAISWYRAKQTNQWSSWDEAPNFQPRFNYEDIKMFANWIKTHERKWDEYLEGRDVLRLVYENISDSVVHEIAAHIGTQADTDNLVTGLEIQRDDITEKWVEMFKYSRAALPMQ